MTRIVPGQLWSLMDSLRPRYTLRITRTSEKIAFGTLANGKKARVELSVLQHGRRGARLVERADGSLAGPCERQKRDAALPRVSVADTKTASDYIKTKAPKGVTPANQVQREALTLREAGASVDDLCAKYGKTRGIINAWISRAREAREDERNVAALKRVG